MQKSKTVEIKIDMGIKTNIVISGINWSSYLWKYDTSQLVQVLDEAQLQNIF